MTNTRKSASLRRLHVITASAIPVVGLLLSTTGFAADTTWKGGGTNATVKDGTNWSNGVPATNKEGLINDSVTIPSTLYWGDASTTLGGSETLGALTLDSTTLTAINASLLPGSGATTFSIAFVGNTGNTIPLISLGPDVTGAVSINDSFTSPATILNLQLGMLSSGIGMTNASASLTISSRLVNKGGVTTANLVKTGAGLLALTNVSNSFVGQVQISAGTLSVPASTPLGVGVGLNNTVELDGGFLAATNTASIGFAKSIIVDSNGGGITTSSTAAATLSDSSPLGGSGSFTKNGAAELFLNNAAGTFNGTINVTQGSLRIINPGSTASGTTIKLNGSGNPTLNLRADADSTYNANVEVAGTSGQVFVANQSTFVASHVLSVGTVKLANTLNIGGSNGYTVQSGAVTLTGNGSIATNTASMNITGGIGESAAGSVFTKTGVSNLTINGSTTYTGKTVVLTGNLILKGTSAWNAPLNGPGVADVQGGSLTFDYTGISTPTATVRAAIKSGQIQDSVAAANMGIGYADDGTSKVNVVPTFFGDATLDGSVSSADFDVLAAHFGESDSSVSWADGDFNYDGIVNALDFNALASNYGQPVMASQPADEVVSLGSVVPEPTSLMFIAVLGGFVMRRRRAQI